MYDTDFLEEQIKTVWSGSFQILLTTYDSDSWPSFDKLGLSGLSWHTWWDLLGSLPQLWFQPSTTQENVDRNEPPPNLGRELACVNPPKPHY